AGRLIQVLGEHLRRDRLNDGAYIGVVQLGLCLRLELRIGQLDTDHSRQALPHIISGEVAILLLEKIHLARVVVERARQGAAETGDVHAAVSRVNAVGKGKFGVVQAAFDWSGRLIRTLLIPPKVADRWLCTA